MRHLRLAPALFVAVVFGCASPRGPAADTGPTLTIRNEAHALFDFSYRCVDNGPVRRLGTVAPLATETFALRPDSCTTVHLVRQPVDVAPPDAPAFAVVPMLSGGSVEVVISATGVMMTRRAVAPSQ